MQAFARLDSAVAGQRASDPLDEFRLAELSSLLVLVESLVRQHLNGPS
jgi:hypothetical protein